ncbi:MAG: DUF3990 domain-containing protein [Coriobacteriales bacterium]|jgi:hypothetical protein|nr:DUF3990 domain-containing protein [Coriobacteriales bacterium]
MKQHADSIVLYHSSTVEVAEPQWDFAAGTDSERNDFGLGFYTSLNQEQPVMLLCDRPQVVLNQYRLDLTGLRTKFRQRVVQERAMVDEQVAQVKEQRFREGQLLSEILRGKVDDGPQVL